MAKANIDISIDLQKAQKELQILLGQGKATADELKNYFRNNFGNIFPDLKPEVQRGIVTPSGNARMAIAGVAQSMNDAQMFQQSFRMGMMSIGNNVDMVTQSLVNLNAEAKRNGSTMGKELLNVIKGPSGILLGISMLITALTVLPGLFDKSAEAADRAAKGGLNNYLEVLTGVPVADIEEIQKNTDARKKALEKERDSIFATRAANTPLGQLPVLSKEEKQRTSGLEKQIAYLNDLTKKNEDAIIAANELQAILEITGGIIGTRPYDRKKRDAQIAAMKEGIDKEKAIADQKLKDDETRAEKEIANQKARDEIIQNLRKAHARKIAEIEKPLRDAEILSGTLPLSEQFKKLGMSGADLERVMKFDRSGADNQLAELEKMKEIVAKSDLSGDKKFSVTKDIENEIQEVKRKKIEAEFEVLQVKLSLIHDEEARDVETIRIRFDEKIKSAELEKVSDEEIALLKEARDAEIERKRSEHSKRRFEDEKRLQKEISELAMYAGQNELQVRLRSIHAEYDAKRERIEELRKLNKITAEEELDYLRGLKNAEEKDRDRATRQYHETLRNEWRQTHEGAMLVINSINAGVRQMWGQWIVGHRQARDEADAIWLAIRNTALMSLGDIVAKYIENELISRSMSAATTAATVAEMTAISIAAAPAALAVNVATMGAAGAAAAGTFATASGSLAAAMATLRITAAADGARINKPTLTLIGEAGEPELIAPEKDFYSIARNELVPNIMSMIARDGLRVDGLATRSQPDRSEAVSMRKVERGLKEVYKAIKGLDLSVDISDDRLLWIVKNRERIERFLQFES